VLVLVDVLVGVAVGRTREGVTPVGVNEGVSVEVRAGVTVEVGIPVAMFVGVTGKGVGVAMVGGGARREVGVTVGLGAPIRTCGGISRG